MSVKAYVAGLKDDAVQSAVGVGFTSMEALSRVAAARDKTDVNRESKRIQESADQFLNSLKYDRDHQGYADKANDWYNDAVASITDNTALSPRARKELLENQLPQFKEGVLGRVPVLQQNAHMAEIKVEVDQYGDVLASHATKPLSEAVTEYKSHIEDLDLFNEVTVGKMVNEYEYATAPIKAVQALQVDYIENNKNDDYSFSEAIDKVAADANLDAAQKAAMKKKALEFQDSHDKQLDSQFKEQKDIIMGQVMEAADNEQFLDTGFIDEYITRVPKRHKLELYPVKNTINANNDNIITKRLKEVTDNNVIPGDDVWEFIGLMYDPYKRDEVAESVLINYGDYLVASGGSLADARRTIDSFDKVSLKNKREAKAQLTKQYLSEEGDVTKIAKDMMSTAASTKGAPITAATTSVGKKLSIEDTIYIDENGGKVLLPTVVDGNKVTEQEAISHYQETGEHLGKFEKEDDLLDYLTKESTEGQELAPEDPLETVFFEPEDGLEDEELAEEDGGWLRNIARNIGAAERLHQEGEQQLAERSYKQMEKIQSAIGLGEKEEEKHQRHALYEGMDQVDLVATALEVIRSGDGRYLSTSELSLIKDKGLREEITELASIRDSFGIDSPFALDFIDQLKRDPAVPEGRLVTAVRDFVDKGLIKADTAEDLGLTKKYSFADNPNWKNLEALVKGIVEDVIPVPTSKRQKKKGTYRGDRRVLESKLLRAADEAITMNPRLIVEDIGKLEHQLTSFAYKSNAESIFEKLEDVAKFLGEQNITKRIDNLAKSDVSTFLVDVQEGHYDVLINWDFVQGDAMRASRNDKKDVLMDKVTVGLTHYKDYKDLKKNGTYFERLKVMANTSFILSGGALEKAFKGSFNMNPSDMTLIEKQWAFNDPEIDGLYFIATDTDMKGRGTLGWGMALEDSDGVRNIVRFKDYVDPQLAYTAERLRKEKADPLYKRQQMVVEAGPPAKEVEYNAGTPSALSMLMSGDKEGATSKYQQGAEDKTSKAQQKGELATIRENEKYYKAKYKVSSVEEEYEKTTEILSDLINDLFIYRANILGIPTRGTPTRLRMFND